MRDFQEAYLDRKLKPVRRRLDRSILLNIILVTICFVFAMHMFVAPIVYDTKTSPEEALKLELRQSEQQNEPDDILPHFTNFTEEQREQPAVQYEIGKTLISTNARTKLPTLANKWFQKAAEHGNSNAQYELGFSFQYGRGAPRNMSAAFDWYNQAAEQNHKNAVFKVGYFRRYGLGTPVSLKQALDAFEASVQNNIPEAFFELGKMQEAGLATPKDPDNAYRNYKKALKLGYKPAKFALQTVKRHVSPELLAD